MYVCLVYTMWHFHIIHTFSNAEIGANSPSLRPMIISLSQQHSKFPVPILKMHIKITAI